MNNESFFPQRLPFDTTGLTRYQVKMLQAGWRIWRRAGAAVPERWFWPLWQRTLHTYGRQQECKRKARYRAMALIARAHPGLSRHLKKSEGGK